MSNAIRLLEAMGSDPALARMTAAQYDAAVTALAADAALDEALRLRNPARIGAALGARSTMYCLVAPAEDDAPVKEDEPQDDEEKPEER